MHLDGAIGLLRTIAWRNYKEKRPSTKIQLQFFFAAHIKYFEMELSPSTQLTELSQLILNNKRTEDATASAVIEIAIRFIDLHASVRRKELIDPVKIVSGALLLDTELAQWEAGLPPNWNFTARDVEESAATHFNGKNHA